MTELDPRTNPSGYAYAFTNEYAPAYAREAIEEGTVTDTDTPGVLTPEEWAHETADSLAAVIYTGQAVALYASGLFDSEDDDGASGAYAGEDSVVAGIDAAIVALSYTWHKRILCEAVEELLGEREDDDSDDD